MPGSQSSRTMYAGVGHPKQSVPADADRQAEASTRGCSDLPHVRFSAEAAAVWVCPTKGSTTCLSPGSAYKCHTSSERVHVAQTDCSLCHVKPASNSSLCYSLGSLQHVYLWRFCVGMGAPLNRAVLAQHSIVNDCRHASCRIAASPLFDCETGLESCAFEA